MVVRPRAPNLLILGASGNVARAFLRRLGGRRAHFGRLILLDKTDHVRHDRYLEHRRLDYRFVRHRLRFPQDFPYYRQLLRRHRINIVVDLTDADTLPLLAASDAAAVSYVCTSLNDEKLDVAQLVATLHPDRDRRCNAPHILCTGMNPGAVNIWVLHGVRRYGVPQEIVHFEYDTSAPTNGWRPILTWSRKEFLTEAVWEPTGVVVDGAAALMPKNSLNHRVDLGPIMKPVLPLPAYPRGLLVLHEENLTLGSELKTSSRFVYAIHPRTMAYIARRWRNRGHVSIADLEIGDNTSIPLKGADSIGVYLDYPRHRVYYLHSLANRNVVGTNATCAQVAVGIYAALFTLLCERLSRRVYFVGDLYDTLYTRVLFCNMRVEQFVFAKRKRSLVLRHHIPDLRPRSRHGEEQLII
ncbi:MAG TPA: hypothetical protein VL486_00090 [Verrucomicrobiae bacterium]|nr:hypothetical protein [Verrucomicrobiae bacterium]